MTAETVVGAVGREAEFRTCQYTGLKVDTAAQTLIKANASWLRSRAGPPSICCRRTGSI